MPAKDKTPGYAIQMQTVVGRATPQTIIISTGCPNTATSGEILTKIRLVNQALLATVRDLNTYEMQQQAAERAELEAQQAIEHAAGPAPSNRLSGCTCATDADPLGTHCPRHCPQPNGDAAPGV